MSTSRENYEIDELNQKTVVFLSKSVVLYFDTKICSTTGKTVVIGCSAIDHFGQYQNF